jgi:hypothetical protein
MKLLASLVMILLMSSPAFAQQRKVFKINPGQKVIEGIPPQDLYKYRTFIPGEVYFKNGRVGTAQMNYNNLYAEIQFVSPKMDTLSLSEEKSIDFIKLNTDTFFYHEGYLESIGVYGPIRIAKQDFIDYVKKEKLDGYGQKSSASIETYSSMSGGGNQALRDLVAKEILTFAPYTNYYIGDRFNKFKAANRKNLLSMFGKDNNREARIDNFLKTESIDFRKEDDLLKVAVFISNL